MKDLHRCLDEYPDLLLRAIAEAWRITLPDAEPREQAHHLAEAMLEPSAIDLLIATLSPAAQQALAVVVQEEGAVPAHRLALRFGAIRRFGPSRLERERPWQEPANGIEELYYKGLLYRVYGAVGPYHGEILLAPDPLRSALPALEAGHLSEDVQQVGEPHTLQSDGMALMEDVFVTLVRLRSSRIPMPVELVPPGKPPAFLAQLRHGPRLRGELGDERLGLIWRLLRRLHLVHESNGVLRPSLRAREWLRLSDLRRMQSLFRAWRDDPQWDELRLVPWLLCENSGWQNNPVETRQAILSMVGGLAQGTWFDLESYLRAVKDRRPDFMRPDGDFESWYIRDAHTGRYLTGFGTWKRVEGAVARHILTLSLKWLGVVDVGYSPGELYPDALRLTKLGAQLLSQSGDMVPVDGNMPNAVTPQVADDLTVTLTVQDSLYERYQLERFAEWRSQDDCAVYQMTEQSLWESHNSGINVEQILGFLRRVSAETLPPAVELTLRAWSARYGQATLGRVVVLETANEETMRQIRGRRETARLLGAALSPTKCLVAESDQPALLRLLRDLGIWAQLKS